MKNRITFLISVVMISVMFPNCATLFSHSHYPVTITSNPPGAHVLLLDKHGFAIYDGLTPAYLNLEAGAGYFIANRFQIRIDMDGYDDNVTIIHSTIDPWFFANLLLGGVIGMLIVDPATGAMWQINERYVDINLVPNNEQALIIININDIPEDYKGHLIRIN